MKGSLYHSPDEKNITQTKTPKHWVLLDALGRFVVTARTHSSIVSPMLIGLTGGIACGKTTVSAMLNDLGATVVDADRIARHVVAPGTSGLDLITKTFGDWVVGPDGELDRERLGQHIFANPAARQQLEAITHPLIAEASARAITDALRAQPLLVVYDAALLIEAGRADAFRPLVVVFVDHATQLARLIERDGLSDSAAAERIKSQMPVGEKAKLADHVIDNSGSRENTKRQVKMLWETLHDQS